MKQASLLFLLDGDNILLAMKKRGFGVGWWNGVGGKPEPNEKIEQTALRECYEEIGVKAIDLKKVATLNFNFPGENNPNNQQVIVFVSSDWEGFPIETEEMSPKWFRKDEIPYDNMWPDDQYWLPLILEDKYVVGDFNLDNNNNLINHSVSY